MIIRGVDPILLLRELLGYADGLCTGKGGHMHLFSREHLAASSGIIGASGPAGAGFALEVGLTIKFARVCTKETIPYVRHLEDEVLPNKERIVAAAEKLMSGQPLG
jgi:hypothetical protein